MEWYVILGIVLLAISIQGIAVAILKGIKWVSIKTGKGFWATIRFMFFSPVKFAKWSKQARKNKKEFKQARAYKKAVAIAIDEYLFGEFAENRPEIQNHPLVKNHKGMVEAMKKMGEAEAELKQLVNKKKSK